MVLLLFTLWVVEEMLTSGVELKTDFDIRPHIGYLNKYLAEGWISIQLFVWIPGIKTAGYPVHP